MYTSPYFMMGPYGGMIDYVNLAQLIAHNLLAYLQLETAEQPPQNAVTHKRSATVPRPRKTTTSMLTQRKLSGRRAIYRHRRQLVRTELWLKRQTEQQKAAVDQANDTDVAADGPCGSRDGDVQFNGLQGDGPKVGKESGNLK